MIYLKSLLCLLQALLMIVSSFSVYDSNFKLWVDRGALALTSVKDFGFDAADADSLIITDEEKAKCREWYNTNILTDTSPAYNFTIGGKSLRKNLQDWDITVGAEGTEGEKFRHGKTSYITLAHKESPVTATVEATMYEDYAACEWTVFIKNNGSENSPVIKKFHAADCTLDTGLSQVYFSKGSDPAPDDFELMKSAVSPAPMIFNSNGGRSESFLPYFNIKGNRGGVAATVGWTGQWYASLSQTLSGVKFKAKQEFFDAYLTPGEEIRSPLVSLSFYDGKNPLKGFNSLRAWEKDCVYPESIKPLNGYVIANEFSTLTSDDFIEMINSIDEDILDQTDYFWMDAGWYKYDEGWHDGVGNWIPNEERFPEGMKPFTDLIAEKGKKFLLWYEPERVREGTYLYNEGLKHPGWTIQNGDNIMWNLGEDGACEFLSEYISASLIDNGVTMYRQDFNFDPLAYWQKADEEFYGGRKGICENHYVTNLYKYLDYLIRAVDGLIIDNCASGGKRLDTEMTRRSLPLWRSDYNCGDENGNIKPDVLEATQSMTYGLSCWLIYSGTNRMFHSRYASRSVILTNQSVYEPSADEYNAYSEISEYMTRNYYPLTYGGTKADRYLAMQFGDRDEGAALIYKREKVKDNEYLLRLNGLEAQRNYLITDFDDPDFRVTMSGDELMNKGIVIGINESPAAAIIRYRAE